MIDPPVNARKDGDYYDTCPHDGCMEVDALHRSEGNLSGDRETVHDWSIFNADPRRGGCGFTWTRTTNTGARRDQALGREPRWRTRTASGTSMSVPSPQFSANYEAIFGHP